MAELCTYFRSLNAGERHLKIGLKDEHGMMLDMKFVWKCSGRLHILCIASRPSWLGDLRIHKERGIS